MILTRQNLKGGKRVKGFPIREENGQLGYFLGYCPGCNECVMMCMQDRDLLMATFAYSDKTLKKVRKLIEPKEDISETFLRWVGERINQKLNSQRQVVDNL